MNEKTQLDNPTNAEDKVLQYFWKQRIHVGGWNPLCETPFHLQVSRRVFHTSYPSCITTYRANPNSLPSLWFLVLELNHTKLHNSSIPATKGNPISCLLICNTRYKNETRYLNPNLSFILILLRAYEKLPHHRAVILLLPEVCKEETNTRCYICPAGAQLSWNLFLSICTGFLLYVTHKVTRLLFHFLW